MKLIVILLLTTSSVLSFGIRRSAQEPQPELLIHHEYHGPPAPLSKDGRVVDTPEVAEAKAKHLHIHAETLSELAKKMSEMENADAANEERAKAVTASIQMTPELMEMLMAAVAEEQKVQQENQKQSEEALQIKMGEDVKPIFEPNNEIGQENPIIVLQKHYGGPSAPIGSDGRVVDTQDVKLARDMHMLAYKELAELSKNGEKSLQEVNSEADWVPAWREHIIIPVEAPVVGYKGLPAPLGKNGRVVDTVEVERAKAQHRKAHEHAKAIAKRNPPTAYDNLI